MTYCTHIRVRDCNEYGLDVEAFLKYVEKKYSMDLRDVPQWKELVNLLHHNTTDYKRLVQASKDRKRLILNKILVQTTRQSPFELTANLSRTFKVWEDMKIKTKARNSIVKYESKTFINKDHEPEDTTTNQDFTAHPNSEIIEETAITTIPTQKDKIDTDTKTLSESHLPAVVGLNKHKMVSPLESKDSRLSYQSMFDGNDSETEFKEWLALEPSSTTRARPAEFYIIDSSMKEQTILFSILNIGIRYKLIRFVTVTDTSQFKYIKISPLYQAKFIPGISVDYCVKYKLLQNTREFDTSLFFRIGENAVFDAAAKGLLIPIKRRLVSRSITITDLVNIPPAYPWHISSTLGYPTGIINILCKDPHNYIIKITKRALAYHKEPNASELSVHDDSVKTESVQEKNKDHQIEEIQVFSGTKNAKNEKTDIGTDTKSFTKTGTKTSMNTETKSSMNTGTKTLLKTETKSSANTRTKSTNSLMEMEDFQANDIIVFLIEEIIGDALDSFTIDRKNFRLRPYSNEIVTVCFKQHEYIGYHQCFYDVDVYDPNSRDLLMTKAVQVRAEVLPHPVTVFPTILDMSATALVTHGYVEDKIVFHNHHKTFYVHIKIKLTTKMRKVFEVSPTQLVVHPLSSGPVIVKFFTRSFLIKNVTDDLAFFTVKILFNGNQTVYSHIPPMFYEIIAPCAYEFKRFYNEKYFKELPERSQQKHRSISTQSPSAWK